MKPVLRCGLFLAVCAAGLTGLTGCDLLKPPFDVSGTYSGVFGLDDPQFALGDNCGITLELFHLPNVPVIQSTFAGVARLDWDCLLPPVFQDLLGIVSDAAVLPLLATLKDDGSFNFELELSLDKIPPQLRDRFNPAGFDFEEAAGFDAFSISFSGTGVDEDDDFSMDSAEGNLAVLLRFRNGEGETFTLDTSGTFGVDRE
jgi:hypothetical protein